MRIAIAILLLSSVARAEDVAEQELQRGADALSRLELTVALAHFSAARPTA